MGYDEARMIVARSGVSFLREACQPAKYYGNLFLRAPRRRNGFQHARDVRAYSESAAHEPHE